MFEQPMVGQSVLVVCAHSDDQIIGPGGTLAFYKKKMQAQIHTVILSYGESSHPWLKEEITIEMRVKEAQNADKVINGDGVIFFGLKELNFEKEIEEKNIKESLKLLILKYRPDKIFTHSPDDIHPDHRATYRLLMSVIEESNFDIDIYVYDVWNPFNFVKRTTPKLYVDISSTMPKKRHALRCFKSQRFYIIIPLLWSYINAFINGLNHECRFAEKFYKVR